MFINVPTFSNFVLVSEQKGFLFWHPLKLLWIDIFSGYFAPISLQWGCLSLYRCFRISGSLQGSGSVEWHYRAYWTFVDIKPIDLKYCALFNLNWENLMKKWWGLWIFWILWVILTQKRLFSNYWHILSYCKAKASLFLFPLYFFLNLIHKLIYIKLEWLILVWYAQSANT